MDLKKITRCATILNSESLSIIEGKDGVLISKRGFFSLLVGNKTLRVDLAVCNGLLVANCVENVLTLDCLKDPLLIKEVLHNWFEVLLNDTLSTPDVDFVISSIFLTKSKKKKPSTFINSRGITVIEKSSTSVRVRRDNKELLEYTGKLPSEAYLSKWLKTCIKSPE